MVLIRHCVEQSNVDPATNYVINPNKIRHVTIVAKKIHTMSGNVDPASHLNLDLPQHIVTQCVITKKFEVGAEVLFGQNGFDLALLPRNSYRRYGSIDYTYRLADMVKAVSKRLEKNPITNIPKKTNNNQTGGDSDSNNKLDRKNIIRKKIKNRSSVIAEKNSRTKKRLTSKEKSTSFKRKNRSYINKRVEKKL